MATLTSYGAYVPQYRAPLGEIQKFFGRPGRPRSRALATPGLDEDTLTMAFEAARDALKGEPIVADSDEAVLQGYAKMLSDAESAGS